MPSSQNKQVDQPKISKLLPLMKLLTGNVSRTIDQLAAELGITRRTVYRYIDTIREISKTEKNWKMKWSNVKS